MGQVGGAGRNFVFDSEGQAGISSLIRTTELVLFTITKIERLAAMQVINYCQTSAPHNTQAVAAVTVTVTVI